MDNETRWDPILKEWVIVAKNRTSRPVLGKQFTKKKKTWTCPFCPDAPEGSGDWVVKWVPNKFPSLINTADMTFVDEEIIADFYRKRPGLGRCEVILYTQDHDKTLGDLSIVNIKALIELWKSRQEDSMKQPELKYTFTFENRGKVIGVSLAHPHGQLYAFPFVPPKIQKAVDSAREYQEKNDQCLYCKIIETEMKDKDRIVEENDEFVAFIPYFAKWPLEVHIYPKNHYSYISQIPQDQNEKFAEIIRNVVRRLDGLYGFTMPYVMAHHNAPYHVGDVNAYHFHIEFYPPYRGPDRIKYLAGVELGTNTIINPTNPSDNAKKLKEVEI